jgi:predicted O-methyltransferase YrrM
MPIVTTIGGRVRPGPHIFVAIPTHGEISGPTFCSFFEASQMLDAAGYRITLCVETGNCHVDDARNSLVREFLKTECTDLVFIDADVGFAPENLLAIVRPDRDIAAGVYPKKEDAESFPVMCEGELWSDAEGLVPVIGVPAGFLRIRRNVLETLRDKAVPFIGQHGQAEPYHVIFERMIVGNRRMSGDYAFCHKAREAGFSIFVDPELAFTHTGAKTWAGTLGAHWKRAHGLEAAELAARLDKGIRALISGDPTAEDFIDLVQGWGNAYSATPEFLVHIWKLCDGRVLECGTGLSTIVLAAKGCKTTSLEHDPVYASHLQAVLDRYGLKADIQCRPLVDRWYDFAGGDFDAVVIDGPPRTMSRRETALERVRAPLIIWDDYPGGLEDPETVEVDEGHRFAIWKKAA